MSSTPKQPRIVRPNGLIHSRKTSPTSSLASSPTESKCKPPGTSNFKFTRQWWKSSVVYQIYPISFFDSNGDGIGDLNGITSKLDYLRGLGVDVVWLSPVYKSPLADMGYDVSDYCDVDPRYGTLEDWDNLLKETHARGMKLIMDLVVNHTSDEHSWFVESKSSKTNPKRDWYIWRPPRYVEQGNRMPPNNWKSIFQGPAWEYDETTDEYYLHLFVTKQPDLNWENPEVREAVWELMRFWLDRGCDGFRMDVINHISKVEGLPDAPILIPSLPYQPGSAFYINGPKVHDYIKEMNERVLSHYDIMTVGEAPITHSPPDLAQYVYPENKELDMVFQFELIDIDAKGGMNSESPIIWKQWELEDMKAVTEKWQTWGREDGFWNTIFIENHDNSRSVSRFGNDSPQWRALSAKLLCISQITQTGTLYVFQGQEIGMKNAPKSWGLEEYKDVATINFWNQTLEKRQKLTGKKPEEIDMSDIMEGCQRKARDHGRTPVQWDSSPHSGFTTGTPWMRVNEDEWNVANQLNDPDSVYTFWRHALQTRKQNDVLIYGDFKLLFPDHPTLFAYLRSLEDGASALVLMNFSTEPITITEDIKRMNGARLLLSNYPTEGPDEKVKQIWSVPTVLRGYEGRVYSRGECCGLCLAGGGAKSSIPDW